MSERNALCAWAQNQLPTGVAVPPEGLAIAPVTGDAGFRHYYRLNTQPALIAVFAPPERENNIGFVTIGQHLQAAGVHVPTVYAVDYHCGYMLQEDLGDRLLLPLLNRDTVDELYRAAEQDIRRIQAVAPNPAVFPDYSEQLLREEMHLFGEWFVAGLLGIELNASEHQMLEQVYSRLVASARAQPQAVVHRDYHSRNLLVQPDGSLAVIDYQDAVVGPITYDLVSLLKDCYIRWPTTLVRRRALTYLQQACAQQAGHNKGHSVEDEQLLAWFDLMGLQRHIKVLGIFARLALRDGKPHFLHDLPLVLRYILEATRDDKAFCEFHQWFGDRLLPVISVQPWYRPWQQAGESS